MTSIPPAPAIMSLRRSTSRSTAATRPLAVSRSTATIPTNCNSDGYNVAGGNGDGIYGFAFNFTVTFGDGSSVTSGTLVDMYETYNFFVNNGGDAGGPPYFGLGTGGVTEQAALAAGSRARAVVAGFGGDWCGWSGDAPLALPSFAETWVSLRPARTRARPIAMGRVRNVPSLPVHRRNGKDAGGALLNPLARTFCAFDFRKPSHAWRVYLCDSHSSWSSLRHRRRTSRKLPRQTRSKPGDDDAKPQKVLVYLDRAATDEQAVTETLQGAISSCVDRYAVTLFIDLQAVVLATREPKGSRSDKRRSSTIRSTSYSPRTC